ncbi:MAG: CIS tube protein [Janthinobacterium lividum]
MAIDDGKNQALGAPVKAQIFNEDSNTLVPALECLFNPTEYSFTMGNHWTPKRANGREMSFLEYSGGDNSTLTIDLFFDTVEPRTVNGNTYKDVSDYVKTLQSFMTPAIGKSGTKNKRPPYLRFQWGKGYSFKSVLQTMSVRYTLFNQAGDPVRCTASVTLISVESDSEDNQKGTNPTSYAEAGHKRRQVMPQDTLALIAYQEYGNSNRWRSIAEANGLEDPMDLRPGQILAIPPA